jgi:hypothetical protein
MLVFASCILRMYELRQERIEEGLCSAQPSLLPISEAVTTHDTSTPLKLYLARCQRPIQYFDIAGR